MYIWVSFLVDIEILSGKFFLFLSWHFTKCVSLHLVNETRIIRNNTDDIECHSHITDQMIASIVMKQPGLEVGEVVVVLVNVSQDCK